jgi:citrate lyase synthetase
MEWNTENIISFISLAVLIIGCAVVAVKFKNGGTALKLFSKLMDLKESKESWTSFLMGLEQDIQNGAFDDVAADLITALLKMKDGENNPYKKEDIEHLMKVIRGRAIK